MVWCLLLSIDAGTGIRLLGEALVSENGPVDADVLLSHSHWDHIQGLPFFEPLYREGARVRIYGPAQPETPLAEVLRRQMEPAVFPVPLAEVAAEVSVQEIGTGQTTIGPWRIEAIRLQHPGITLGYRVEHEAGGASLAYVTDNELGEGGANALPEDWFERLVERLHGVDVLIHDAMYAEQSKALRIGWGHSTPTEATELALACEAARLMLFHHDPSHDDARLDALLAEVRALASSRGAPLAIEATAEGTTLSL